MLTKAQALIELRERGRVQIDGRLKEWQRDLVERGLVCLRSYQDMPRDVPYPFRPVRHYLVACNSFFRTHIKSTK